MGHSFFAPSSAPRVVECPASLLLTAGMPDNQSLDAAHGTAAHWIADKCLRENHRVEHYAACRVYVQEDGECGFVHIGNEEEMAENAGCYVFEVDDEMINAVQEYVDWCNDTPGDKYPEQRVDISKWCPEVPDDMVFIPAAAYEPQGGTADHAACSPGLLVITDLKYGKGVQVFAERNWQAVLYALGFIHEWDWLYDFKKIVIRICQPRLDHKDEWEVTREEIEEMGRYILERFTVAMSEDAPFGPSEKACKFCKASGACRAQGEYLSRIRALAFEDLDADPPVFAEPNEKLLTDDELVAAWRAHKLYQARFDAIERIIVDRLQDGHVMEGVKLVQSRTFRRWINESAVADELEFAADLPREKLYTQPELISPAKVEKLLPKAKREIVKSLAYVPRGGPCIADESDKRPVYGTVVDPHVEGAFDHLDDPFA
jgi:hypothetical protein